ncbi:hypothetical protein DFJ58DRAFT_838212 [Suillus subalutaceus]|uniref:uncharacterized protein n=1 Tax=Suillus subalutaceus TaxID=48586 RepID=UPI001B87AD79|nr:uncharacterized protein DFJ58DRAFT_838212 [Suillus subalutaceus]KAG1867207.1 hypothetical protein DFJ58DRAFT_838212 [Suillus subalutaceus]
MDLELSSEEWTCVQCLLSILGVHILILLESWLTSKLQYAELSQQSFSSEQGPMLHLALPALESLHSAWSSCSGRIKYLDFAEGLDAGIEKIAKYYEKSSSSDAHIMAMCALFFHVHITPTDFLMTFLDPSQKETHIHKYWGEELLAKAHGHAEEMYKERYLEMYGNNPDSRNGAEVKVRKTGNCKLDALLQELSDSEDDSDSMLQPTLISHTSSVTLSEAANEPWRQDFHAYLNSKDYLGDMTIVQCQPQNFTVHTKLTAYSSYSTTYFQSLTESQFLPGFDE